MNGVEWAVRRKKENSFRGYFIPLTSVQFVGVPTIFDFLLTFLEITQKRFQYSNSKHLDFGRERYSITKYQLVTGIRQLLQPTAPVTGGSASKIHEVEIRGGTLESEAQQSRRTSHCSRSTNLRMLARIEISTSRIFDVLPRSLQIPRRLADTSDLCSERGFFPRIINEQ